MTRSYLGRNGTQPKTLEDFWDHVVKTDKCWFWTGALFTDGYGQFSWNGKNWRVHRLVLAIFENVDIVGVVVRHTCDTPTCVNPKHLKVGLHKDNMLDMVIRGRAAAGERSAHAKLTNQLANQLREEYEAEKKVKPYGALIRLSTKYNIPKQIVYRVVAGKTYVGI